MHGPRCKLCFQYTKACKSGSGPVQRVVLIVSRSVVANVRSNAMHGGSVPGGGARAGSHERVYRSAPHCLPPTSESGDGDR